MAWVAGADSTSERVDRLRTVHPTIDCVIGSPGPASAGIDVHHMALFHAVTEVRGNAKERVIPSLVSSLNRSSTLI